MDIFYYAFENVAKRTGTSTWTTSPPITGKSSMTTARRMTIVRTIWRGMSKSPKEERTAQDAQSFPVCARGKSPNKTYSFLSIVNGSDGNSGGSISSLTGIASV